MDKNVSYEKYAQYISVNINTIIKYVDLCFEERKEYVKDKFIEAIKKTIKVMPIDEIAGTGDIVVNLNQKAKDFFLRGPADIYKFEKVEEAGLMKDDRNVSINSVFDETIYEVMYAAIKECIERNFVIKLTKEELEEILNICGDYDKIFDNSVVAKYSNENLAAEMLGISDMKLKDIL